MHVDNINSWSQSVNECPRSTPYLGKIPRPDEKTLAFGAKGEETKERMDLFPEDETRKGIDVRVETRRIYNDPCPHNLTLVSGA